MRLIRYTLIVSLVIASGYEPVRADQPVASPKPGTVQPLPSPAKRGAAEPFVSTGRHGMLMSWLEPVPGSDRTALRLSRLQRGAWTAPATIVERDDLFVNWADFPSVVEDGNGVLYAQWLQKSGSHAYDVHMATSRDGRKWSAPFLLNRDGKEAEHGFVSLVPLPTGGVAVSWLDGRKMAGGEGHGHQGEMMLRYATVDANGGIAGEVELDGRTCECCATGMAVSSRGPVIVYRDRSADEIRDIARIVRGKSGWSAPALVHRDGWKIAGCPVNGPQIDAVGDRAAVAWFTGANGAGGVYAAFSTNGGSTFEAPVRVDSGKPLGRVDLVMLDGDTAFVTWLEQSGGGAEVQGRRVHRKGSAEPAITIGKTTAARAAGFARAARDGRSVIVAWTDQTESEKQIRAARINF